MTLRLHNSRTGDLSPFRPLNPGTVGMYLCGLTVQGPPHLGHVRSAVNFDVLRRWLTWHGNEVTLIRNVTDIDDKILNTAAALDRPWWAHATLMRHELDSAYAALRVLPPTHEPLATGHISEMVTLIGRLVEAGHAYQALDGSASVYFHVRSWPDYGSLTGQSVDAMRTEETSEEDTVKKDPSDFALWKATKPTDPATASWGSPWGPGRPGWHIECSAMAGKYLGDTFDIHAGGLDLRFPHHENEQAQSRAAGGQFAARWLHNAWITVAGSKMGKSLGNALAVSRLLEDVRGTELRFYILTGHYRSHMEYSPEALEDAARSYRSIERFLSAAPAAADGVGLPDRFVAALNDDLATPAALSVIFDEVRAGNRALDDCDHAAAAAAAAGVTGMLDVLGLSPDATTGGSAGEAVMSEALGVLVQARISAREQARRDRDFAAADRIRDDLAGAGVILADTAEGTRWELARP